MTEITVLLKKIYPKPDSQLGSVESVDCLKFASNIVEIEVTSDQSHVRFRLNIF